LPVKPGISRIPPNDKFDEDSESDGDLPALPPGFNKPEDLFSALDTDKDKKITFDELWD